jgi:hypothetical protein
MNKYKFAIDGDLSDPANIVEGYTDGATWNGWECPMLPKDQLQSWLDASPYDYRFFTNSDGNESVRIYFDDREEVIDSSPLFTPDGLLTVYPMEGYCFVQVEDADAS